jgi:F-type H+-transporting ATPase subunit epsilon
MATVDTTGGARANAPGARALQVVVVTPEKTLIDESVDFVSIPLYDGELGVLPGRSPLIARLGYGELRTKVGETVKHYYVDGGFAQIRDNVVTLLTNRAQTPKTIEPAAAEAQLTEALARKAVTELEYAEKARAVARSRALIRMAKYSS